MGTDWPVMSRNRTSLTMSALSSPFFQFLCPFSFFHGHTTPFTPRSGLIGLVHLSFDDHGSFVIVRSVSVRPKHLFDQTSTMITSSNSLCRERDAQSSAQCSIAHHVRFRAVPRTNRTQTMANSRNHSATSSTSEPLDGVPVLPWQCFCVDALPDVRSDVSTPG